MKARYPGDCIVCHRPIQRGMEIEDSGVRGPRGGKKMVHVACFGGARNNPMIDAWPPVPGHEPDSYETELAMLFAKFERTQDLAISRGERLSGRDVGRLVPKHLIPPWVGLEQRGNRWHLVGLSPRMRMLVSAFKTSLHAGELLGRGLM